MPYPRSLTDVAGTLFLTANDGTHGRELWRSDGTAAGTELLADVVLGPEESRPRALADLGSTLFFTADDGTHGRELWKVVP